MSDQVLEGTLRGTLALLAWAGANLPYALFLAVVVLSPIVLAVRRHPRDTSYLALALVLGALVGCVFPLLASLGNHSRQGPQGPLLLTMFLPIFTGPLFGLVALSLAALADLTLRRVRRQLAVR